MTQRSTTLPARTTDVVPATDPHRMGLVQSTALIAGSIVGVGIFSLPYSLAGFGPISLVAMAATTVGAVALALLYAALSRREPAAGGPYAYARIAFGNRIGFANAWSYWITAWAGNAAIAVGWVYYAELFLNPSRNLGLTVGLTLAALWVPALINLSGLRNVGWFQVLTTITKFIPLVLMGTVGLFFIRPENFVPWNASGLSDWSAVGGAMAICLFTYLGVETAAVASAKVRNPRRNVPRATLLGTLASAAVYLLSLLAVFGILSSGQLGSDENRASFAAAATAIAGGGSWAGAVVAVIVIISGVGALNGWTMICAEMPQAAAEDGLFPRAFAKVSRRQVPAFGIISSTTLASIAALISFWGATGSDVFTTLVLMTGITAAIPYGFSAAAQLSWRVRDRSRVRAGRMIFDLTVAVLSLIFAVLFVWYSRNSGDVWYVTWGPFLLTALAFLIGIPVYLAERRRMTPPPTRQPPAEPAAGER